MRSRDFMGFGFLFTLGFGGLGLSSFGGQGLPF